MTLLDSHQELLAVLKDALGFLEGRSTLTSVVLGAILRGEIAQKEAVGFDDKLKAAASEIDRLQALVPRWRTLEEDSPADGQFCAVAFDKSKHVLPAVWTERGKAFGILGGFGQIRSDLPIIEGWQPLPAPPQPEER